ncbi:MAG: terpene cyclase/mutase family protein [Planctomycetes bacterium]|nr:terpene cyclase/mutase family protein [Planctomycetota bacterium]
MARPNAVPPEYDEDLPDEHDEETHNAGLPSGWAFAHTPWWCLSLAFHLLVIFLVGLITMTVNSLDPDQKVVTTIFEHPQTVSKLEVRAQEANTNALLSKFTQEGIDKNAEEAAKFMLPKEVWDKVKVGDHDETKNEDLEDTKGAHGVQEASEYLPIDTRDTQAGGGGTDGAGLEDDMIGASGKSTLGTGGGFGGGMGMGTGADKGPGKALWGFRNKAGREWMVKRFNTSSDKLITSANDSLRWLAKHQETDGHWDCVKYGGKQADVAVTGLALLAFLGSGHTEKVGEYRDNVKRAVYWLESIQNPSGAYYKQGETHGIGYHHAIAGLAMAEAAGMSHIPDTVKSAQKGVDYSIEKHQQGENSEKLGWRYGPKSPTADLSVSGWFIMQLKSAKIAGLKTDPAALAGAIRFLDSVEQKGNPNDVYGGHRYGYTTPGAAVRTTAIGCLCRQFLGWKRDELQGGVDFFVKQGGVPKWDGNGGSVDLYYWYYGTLCTFQQQGDVWKEWNTAMKKALLDNQRKGGDEDGSWDPVGAYSEYWGRVGQTALACLCLEVYYRYLPMYKPSDR